MEEMIRILREHRANFSVEFFAGSGYAKVKVRKSGMWTQELVWESAVFKELKEMGYEHCGFKMLRSASLATPTAVVDYEFAPGE